MQREERFKMIVHSKMALEGFLAGYKERGHDDFEIVSNKIKELMHEDHIKFHREIKCLTILSREMLSLDRDEL